MKKILGLLILALSTQAFAATRIDLTATALKFGVGVDDDVNNVSSQHIFIYFRNDGNVTYQNRTPMMVTVKGIRTSGYVYGSDERGGGLWDRVLPGEMAKIFVRLPLNTLSHCENVPVVIDVGHTHQVGIGVFDNDAKTMKAYSFAKSPLLCSIIEIDPRLPLPRFPR